MATKKSGRVEWVRFTRRTDDPKLAWLECQLAMRGIPSRRRGFSFHGPILEVPAHLEDAAWALLRGRIDGFDESIDDMEDDHEVFQEMWGCDPRIAQRLLSAGRAHEVAHMERLTSRIATRAPAVAKKIAAGYAEAARRSPRPSVKKGRN